MPFPTASDVTTALNKWRALTSRAVIVVVGWVASGRNATSQSVISAHSIACVRPSGRTACGMITAAGSDVAPGSDVAACWAGFTGGPGAGPGSELQPTATKIDAKPSPRFARPMVFVAISHLMLVCYSFDKKHCGVT